MAGVEDGADAVVAAVGPSEGGSAELAPAAAGAGAAAEAGGVEAIVAHKHCRYVGLVGQLTKSPPCVLWLFVLQDVSGPKGSCRTWAGTVAFG